VNTAALTAVKNLLGLSNTIYVPALQFIPAQVSNVQGAINACPLVIEGMSPTNLPSDLPHCTSDFVTNATQMRGIFRARLIG